MTSKIKISELFFFFSVQGEGRYMGVPSVFLRTFGCNFTCAGFGMPPGQVSMEADQVAAQQHSIKKYTDLPLVTTGCDSYGSWHPKLKHLSPLMSIDDIVARTMELLPNHQWGDCHLVITGGEPLLGWQRSYAGLLNHPEMWGLTELTFETNGTQSIHPELANYLKTWNLHPRREITFSVSPKLPVSGEPWDQAIRPDIVASYHDLGYVYLKFVVATQQDVDHARQAIEEYRAAGFHGPVYLMPVGGVESVYALNNRAVAELALKHGLRYSDRLQVPLFKNQWNT